MTPDFVSPPDAGLHPGYHIICRVNSWQVGMAGGAGYFLHDDGRRIKVRDQAEVLAMARLINNLRNRWIEWGEPATGAGEAGKE